MVIQRLLRAAAFALVALGFAACSSATWTRLAYNNAAFAYGNLGSMLTWVVDDFVDLEGAREDWVRDRIDRLLAWHRAEELPRYRGLLDSMLAKSAQPYKVEDIAAHQRELRAAWHRILAQAIPDAAEFLVNAQPRELDHLQRKFDEDNRKFLRASVRGTPEERLERRIRRFVGHLESWVGRLTAEQRQLVANRYHDLADVTEEIVGERRFRQGELLALARSRPSQAQMEAGLRRLYMQSESWRRPEFTAKLRERDAQLHGLIADLSSTMSDAQRANLQNRIRRFLGDISTLTASA